MSRARRVTSQASRSFGAGAVQLSLAENGDSMSGVGMIKSCLDRLLAESARHKDLRDAVEAALVQLEEEKQGGEDVAKTISADRYWNPFKIACHNTQPARTREVALDCLQKLIAHNLLRGALPLTVSNTPTAASSTAPGTPGAPANDLSQLDTSSPATSPQPLDEKGTEEQDEENGTQQVAKTAVPVFAPRSTSLLPSTPAEAPNYPPIPFLIDEIIHTVCTTLAMHTDEAVQLQVLKVLLTAVTSTGCEVHEVSLLKVVQTCFNIHLHSRTQVNQMTAKASLTQMINLIFSRMERYAEVLAKSLETGSMGEIEKLTGLSAMGAESLNQYRTNVKARAINGTSDAEEPTDTSKDPEPDGEVGEKSSKVESEILGVESQAENDLESKLPQIEVGSLAVELQTAGELADKPLDKDAADPPDGCEHEENENVPDASAADVASTAGDAAAAVVQGTETATPDHENATSIRGAAADEASDQSSLQSHMTMGSNQQQPEQSIEVGSTLTPANPVTGNNPYDPTIAYYNELLRKDVFLVFRLLCRLSLTSDSSQNTMATFSAANVKEAASMPMDELSHQSTKARQLALELIMSVMNNCGPVFQSDDLYTGLVRHNLCLSISRNGITTNPTLFELSLSIFLMVTRFYRSKLKTEIEVLLNTIYLHILEMGNSTYNQKRMVLQGLLKICENPQTLADMYLNYDCDIAMVSIFERIVNVCSRVAQGRDSNAPPAPTGLMGLAASAAGLDTKEQLLKAQERRLKLRGLCCLVALVTSLTEWSKDVAPNLPLSTTRRRRSGDLPRVSIASNRDASENTARMSVSDDRRDNKSSPTQRKSTDGTKPASAGSDNPTKSFLDALAPTNQVNPVLVYKHPLHSVSMDHVPYMFPNNSTTSLQSVTTVTPDEDSSQIETVASRKQLLRNDIRQFNMKPKAGIKALIEDGFVEEDAESVARFLRTTDGLTKAAIGEYLGEGHPFNIDVMHVFIDNMDFTNIDFVPALRSFLQTFRLPGEAQKIDRIMEKFADRYYENNPDVFAKADTAYTLAFSVIMLNTDQHSAEIKHRMDKNAFIKNNRGINDEGDLPEEYLAAIFDEVSNNEIVLEEEQAGKLAQMAIGWGAGDLNDRQRMELYRKEIQMVQKKSQQLIQNANRTVAPFRTAVNADLARPMFGMASWPLMAVFSLAFEAANDEEDVDDAAEGPRSLEPKAADLCLEGFAGSIRLASIFRMETERDAFVTSLSKLTGLSHIQDIRPKNIKAIKTLIMIANVLGEYLESSWMQVLKAISQLERLQLIANRGSFDNATRQSGDAVHAGDEATAADLPYGGSAAPVRQSAYRTIEDLTSNSRPNPAVEKLIAEFHNQATVVAVDRIFTNTLKLSATAIIHFFRCLCHVSMEEVGLDPSAPVGGMPQVLHSGAPRMYLLQKIVEIAYYNMPRIRFEWTQIWRILQPYFNTVACHPNTTVSTFAVDSLRQLSMKFLEREELGHYSAQNEFLKSFEWIMKHNANPAIRELILSSMAHMIAARARSIRSGWRSIFVVLAKAAQSSSGDEKMIKTAFGIVQVVFREHFDAVNHAGGFVDYVACLAEFALLEGSGQTYDEVVMGSIQLLQSCANYLVKHGSETLEGKPRRSSQGELDGQKPVPPAVLLNGTALSVPPTPTSTHPPRAPSQPYLQANGMVSEEHFFLKWFPILSAFSRVVIDSESVTVRTRTIDALFDTLKSAGQRFDVKYWKNIQRSVILPIFADLGERTDSVSQEQYRPRGKEADTAIWVHGLRLYADLTTSFFEKLATAGHAELMKGVLDLLIGMLQRRDEKLATTGGICLHGFVRDNLGRIGKCGSWGVITDGVEKAFATTLPAELLCCDYGKVSSKPLDANSNRTESVGSEVVSAGYTAARAVGTEVTLDTLDFEHTLVKCVTHLELVQALRDIAFTKLVGSGRRGSEAKVYVDKTQSGRNSIVADMTATERPVDKSDPGSTPVPPVVPEQKQVLAINIIPPEFRHRWLKCLYDSYAVARAFNEENDLRYAIYRRGLVPQLPHLVKQETLSFATYLRMLFAVYRAQSSSTPFPREPKSPSTETISMETAGQGDASVLPELVKHTLDVLGRYVECLNDQQRNQLHIGLWSPVVAMVFKELLGMEGLWTAQAANGEPSGKCAEAREHSDGSVHELGTAAHNGISNGPQHHVELKQHVPRYFKFAVKMMGVDRPEVRTALQEFMERVGDEYIR
ncbi:hypothetical protein, variant [Spizellomyces punctatus DAOM BR117]|uniref:SEC7 domain-containing protein n=1 Tax=Spizellomyces punctatus (strain DAOM BR117) TaxID=645134 RepID=A0A0L0HT24_SPIPD|nr:hypothetical protein, variant [Spizellomyces punctatus DAOM BR117]KND04045.1 hypothetical protein, variant [Spizellomyces punctatus DAOM BR117]|eukprot:XP_016612084.1 hypothetical protein, variant [Spizellomyces punctatus DAOM BR117]